MQADTINSNSENACLINNVPPIFTLELIDMAEEEKLASKVRSMSSYSDHRGDQRPAYHGDLIRCYAHIASEQNFATRANTLQEYCRINREVNLLNFDSP